MKIGIITYWTSNDNYGQALQCWALQEFLRKNGHKPFLIRYSRKNPIKSKITLSKVVRILFHLPKYIKLRDIAQKKQKYYQTTNNEPRRFEAFKEQYLDKTEIIYNEKTIKENPPKSDYYICGSDQIWGEDEIYYLNFLPKGAKKIAYAVSMATEMKNRDDEFKSKMKEWLSDFIFIGTRENAGINACKMVGIEGAQQVVDPTLLLDRHDYDHIRKHYPINQPYILLYLIGNPIDMDVKEVYGYAEEKGLKVVYVAVQGQMDEYEKSYPEIGQWIDLVANAELVVTNSFHGTVFSLIYQKPFVAIPLSKPLTTKNVRLMDLLEQTGTSSLLYQGNLDENTKITINRQDYFLNYCSKQDYSKKILLRTIS